MRPDASQNGRGADVGLLVVGRDVITMNARREIVRDGAVAVAGGEIVAVGKASDLRAR